MKMLRGLLLAAAIGLLALALSSSQTPASADSEEVDLAASRHTLVDPPTQIDLNIGVGMQVSLGFKNFTAAVDPAPADIFYTDFDGTFSLFIPAAAMGLDPAMDNIDAADVKPIPPKKEKKGGIPAVSEWGLMVMTLLILAAGTIAVARARRRTLTV